MVWNILQRFVIRAEALRIEIDRSIELILCLGLKMGQFMNGEQGSKTLHRKVSILGNRGTINKFLRPDSKIPTPVVFVHSETAIFRWMNAHSNS